MRRLLGASVDAGRCHNVAATECPGSPRPRTDSNRLRTRVPVVALAPPLAVVSERARPPPAMSFASPRRAFGTGGRQVASASPPASARRRGGPADSAQLLLNACAYLLEHGAPSGAAALARCARLRREPCALPLLPPHPSPRPPLARPVRAHAARGGGAQPGDAAGGGGEPRRGQPRGVGGGGCAVGHARGRPAGAAPPAARDAAR